METNRDFNGEPPFCAAGCGFCGLREQHDLCSKCYAAFLRDQVAKSAAEAPTRQASSSASEVAVSLDDLTALVSDLTLDTSTAESAAEALMGQPSTLASEVAVSLDDLTASASHLTIDGSTPRMIKKNNRCSACNKRIGLLGFECRCGDVFCGAHRYPEEHGCSVDFKMAARRRLAEENPLCKANKMGFRI